MLSVGLAGGYFAGRGKESSATGKAAPAPVVATAVAPAAAKKAAREAHSTEAASPGAASRSPRSLDEIVAKLRQAMNDPRYMRTGQEIFEAIQNLAPSDIPAVLAQLKSGGHQRNSYGVLAALLPRWAEADPEAALAYALGLTRPNERPMAVTAVFNGWARRDLEGAIAAVAGLKSSDEQKAAWAAILPELAQRAPERALELHAKLPKGESQYGYGSSVYGIFNAWAQTDPAAAAARALQLPARDREQAVNGIAAQWAARDLPAAQAWALGLPEGNAKRNATRAVLSELANQNPQAAAQLALSLKGQAQQEAMATVATTWGQTDLTGALAWAQGLPDVKARERAMQSLGPEWARRDPQAAVAYVNGLPSGQMKNNLLQNIASSWANTDSKAALEWVQPFLICPLRERAAAREAVHIAHLGIIREIERRERSRKVRFLEQLIGVRSLGNVFHGKAW